MFVSLVSPVNNYTIANCHAQEQIPSKMHFCERFRNGARQADKKNTTATPYGIGCINGSIPQSSSLYRVRDHLAG